MSFSYSRLLCPLHPHRSLPSLLPLSLAPGCAGWARPKVLTDTRPEGVSTNDHARPHPAIVLGVLAHDKVEVMGPISQTPPEPYVPIAELFPSMAQGVLGNSNIHTHVAAIHPKFIRIPGEPDYNPKSDLFGLRATLEEVTNAKRIAEVHRLSLAQSESASAPQSSSAPPRTNRQLNTNPKPISLPAPQTLPALQRTKHQLNTNPKPISLPACQSLSAPQSPLTSTWAQIVARRPVEKLTSGQIATRPAPVVGGRPVVHDPSNMPTSSCGACCLECQEQA